MMNIWQLQEQISRRLLKWSYLSMAIGVLLMRGKPFWKQLGGQFFTWGAIDAGIAVAGDMAMRQRAAELENPGVESVQTQESQNLRQILLINAGLDVLYILFGWWLRRRDKGDGASKGAGLGIIVQGLFLLIFDLFHADQVPKQ